MQAPDLYKSENETMRYERMVAELRGSLANIQQIDFTRWANSHLNIINKNIESLTTDFSDGLLLIALIEILLNKRFSFISRNARPTSRFQKLENVSFALDLLEMEGIKIVNIGPSDIVDSNLTSILGLMWTLILGSSIEPSSGGANGEGDSVSKQRLLHWIQNKIPDVQIANLTNDWNSGRAIGALVDACAPGLCPYWTDWNPKNSVLYASEAMALAKHWLNVRLLIRPEEMVNPNIDEQSMMTYLSQFMSATLKTGAPLRPKTDLNSHTLAQESANQNEKNESSEPSALTLESYEMEHSTYALSQESANQNEKTESSEPSALTLESYETEHSTYALSQECANQNEKTESSEPSALTLESYEMEHSTYALSQECANQNEKTESSEPSALTLESYEMEHSKLREHEFSINGHMTIFNQEFKNSENYRSGSANDVESLTTTFTRFGIEPSVKIDLKYKEIVEEIDTLSTTDFSTCKLFVCVYMSHGHNNGYASAADEIFNLRSTIIKPIIENKTLNGITKMFIIAACRGVNAYEENDIEEYDGRIRSAANGFDYGNYLISYSTLEGHVSKRTRNGTYFIQTLCDTINNDNGYTKIHSLFAKVNDKLIEMGKQVPVFESSMGDISLRDLASAPNQLTIRLIKKRKT